MQQRWSLWWRSLSATPERRGRLAQAKLNSDESSESSRLIRLTTGPTLWRSCLAVSGAGTSPRNPDKRKADHDAHTH
eukprot:6277803-Prymnesium_polylepis.1